MKKIIIMCMVAMLVSACTFGKAITPKQKVSEFMDQYKNQNEKIISQLEETINSQITEEDQKRRYKTLMTNQYKNLEYKIKDEVIEGDNAVVEVEVTVFDYASAIKNSNTYLNDHINEFKKDSKQTIAESNNVRENTEKARDNVENAAENAKKKVEDTADNVKEKVDEAKDKIEDRINDAKQNDDYDETKFTDYKLSQMEKVKDTVKYTVEFTLTKTNDEWHIDSLSNSDIEKIHGIYIQ